jgi:hypothetical protein
MSERTTCVLLRLARAAVLWAGCFTVMIPAFSVFLFFGSAVLIGVMGEILRDILKRPGLSPVRQAKIMLGSYVLVVLVGVGAVFFIYSPRQMFLRYVADPIPASVEVLDSQYYGGVDSIAYVSFTASPEDIEKLVQAGGYRLIGPIEQPRTPDSERPDMLYAIGPRPAWFTPSKFPDMIQYSLEHEDIDRYDLFYSPATGQAYYRWLSF